MHASISHWRQLSPNTPDSSLSQQQEQLSNLLILFLLIHMPNKTKTRSQVYYSPMLEIQIHTYPPYEMNIVTGIPITKLREERNLSATPGSMGVPE